MRHFAITAILTASWISLTIPGSDMRATPPCARMSAGTRSSAITATAPASSAILACSASRTSMITPPLSISARPLLTRIVPISTIGAILARRPETSDGMSPCFFLLEVLQLALQAAKYLVHLLHGGRDRPEQDCVLLHPHDVVDVRLELLRREPPEGPLDLEGIVRVLPEGDRHGVAGLEGPQPSVGRSGSDDADLLVDGGDAVAELAQALRTA